MIKATERMVATNERTPKEGAENTSSYNARRQKRFAARCLFVRRQTMTTTHEPTDATHGRIEVAQ